MRSQRVWIYTSEPAIAYTLQANFPGFKRTSDGILLRVGDTPANVTMKVGVAEVESRPTPDWCRAAEYISQVVDQQPLSSFTQRARSDTAHHDLRRVDQSQAMDNRAKLFQLAIDLDRRSAAHQHLLDGGDNNDSFTNVNMRFLPRCAGESA